MGGGIKINDGLDNFKSQFGGEKIYNGGLKLVCNKILYENELFKKKNKTEMNNFFPEYLAGKALPARYSGKKLFISVLFFFLNSSFSYNILLHTNFRPPL